MNTPIKLLSLFIRDLMSYDEQLIKIGRANFERSDFSADYIVVDSMGSGHRVAGGKSYNGDTEVLNISDQWRVPCTVNFYGENAYTNANKFVKLRRSQLALELQEQYKFAVFQTSGLTDVKSLTGSQYGNRAELELNVQYTDDIDIDTLRIDTAQFEVLTESGQEQIS